MCDNSELNCQNFYNGSQQDVYDVPMLEMGDIFRINPDLRIDQNSIPHTSQNEKIWTLDPPMCCYVVRESILYSPSQTENVPKVVEDGESPLQSIL